MNRLSILSLAALSIVVVAALTASAGPCDQPCAPPACQPACEQPACEPACAPSCARVGLLARIRAWCEARRAVACCQPEACEPEACQPACEKACEPACQPACEPECVKPARCCGLLARLRARRAGAECCVAEAAPAAEQPAASPAEAAPAAPQPAPAPAAPAPAEQK